MAKRWLGWRQNNSGGYYNDPGKYVLIEANSNLEAIAIFDKYYYTDYDNCNCCGDRWDHEPDYIGKEGYGLYTAMEEIMLGNSYSFMPEYRVPVVFVRWYNGKTESLSWSKSDV